jgi:alpha-L-rhamnosidase
MLSQVLTDNGYMDLAYYLLFNKRYPSWLYPVTMGATTIWERWDGVKPDSTFQDPGMNSLNHYAYGAIGDWIYKHLAGIQMAEQSCGYKKIIIKPTITSRLSFAGADHHSPYGMISSKWSLDEGELTMDISIPVNTTAMVYIPTDSPETIKESGKLLIHSKDLTGIDILNGMVRVGLGSGKYQFTSKLSDNIIEIYNDEDR